jgi:hypothetical protein
MFSRMREAELAIQRMDNHIITEEQDRLSDRQLSANVKAGLTVAAVVALAAFIIWLVDRNNYTQKNTPAEPRPIGAKVKELEHVRYI